MCQAYRAEADSQRRWARFRGPGCAIVDLWWVRFREVGWIVHVDYKAVAMLQESCLSSNKRFGLIRKHYNALAVKSVSITLDAANRGYRLL